MSDELRPHRHAHASAPEFTLDDFVQGPDPEFVDDGFTWVQDAIEQRSEDIAAWGTSGDSGEPFVWYQEADSEASPTLPSAPETAPGRADGTQPAPPAPASSRASHFRPEIEGLRAVAVFMVVAYHVWLGRVSGGVDVFLFISAFLLGSSFARRLDAGQAFAPVAYWLRTFTRLLPPAVVTIAGALVGSAFFLPQSAWQNVITHAIASATYVQNIVLSWQSVDYYALDASTSSPFQHFWSLSLQGQVFLTWPLLFILAAAASRRSRHPRRIAFGIFGTIFAASLAYSVWFTAADQQAAYFSTPARLWEVAAGTLLALALPRLDRRLGSARPGADAPPRHRLLRALAGWVGFALLISLGILINVEGHFPGWLALWPLTAAALIIVAGYSGSRFGFDRILTMKLPRALASSSYSLYLVHWPILIFWLAQSGQRRAGLWDGLAIVAGSMAIAWVVSKLVDSRFKSPAWKSAPPLRSLAVIGLCLAVAVGGALGWRSQLQGVERTAAQNEAAVRANVTNEQPLASEKLVPAGYELGAQWPTQDYDCEGATAPPRSFPHTHCDLRLSPSASANRLVAVVGSSHARHYIPTLENAAAAGNWQIINLSMDGCTYTVGVEESKYCDGYRQWVDDTLTELAPDLVVTVGTTTQPNSVSERATPGVIQAIDSLATRGYDVIAFRDTPRWETSPFTCAEAIADAGGTRKEVDEACGAPVDQKFHTTAGRELAAYTPPASASGKVLPIDLTDEICPSGYCSPIVGNAYVYMDDNHLTRVFSETLAPAVARQIQGSSLGVAADVGKDSQ